VATFRKRRRKRNGRPPSNGAAKMGGLWERNVVGLSERGEGARGRGEGVCEGGNDAKKRAETLLQSDKGLFAAREKRNTKREIEEVRRRKDIW